jgi:hypothetical protein
VAVLYPVVGLGADLLLAAIAGLFHQSAIRTRPLVVFVVTGPCRFGAFSMTASAAGYTNVGNWAGCGLNGFRLGAWESRHSGELVAESGAANIADV